MRGKGRVEREEWCASDFEGQRAVRAERRGDGVTNLV